VIQIHLVVTVEHVEGPERSVEKIGRALVEALGGETLEITHGGRGTYRSLYLVDEAEVTDR